VERVNTKPEKEPFYRAVDRSEQVELEGPFKCSRCHGQVMLESTFLAVKEGVFCPFCGIPITKFCDETVTNIDGYRIKHGENNPLREWMSGKG